MGTRTVALACASVLSMAHFVSAQPAESLTAMQTAVACASPPVMAHEPVDAIRIAGSQDVVNRGTFGSPEVLVLSHGANHGVRVNDIYFSRRIQRGAETLRDKLPHAVMTSGWVRVVAVNEKMALVSPEHVCSDIRTGDFLEPFVAPVVVEDQKLAPLVQAELNFDAYARVLHGEFDRQSIGTNEFATIAHGFDRNVRIGTRFAIYRDLEVPENPLKRIGEAIAVSVGPDLTVVRVTSARDAVFSGDVMVPRTSDGVVLPPPPDAPPSRPFGCRNEDHVPPQSRRCAD
jgi:hypothetical protein